MGKPSSDTKRSHLLRAYKSPQVITGILSASDRLLVRKRLALVAVCLVVVAAVVASVANSMTTNSTPEQALTSYFRALERGNYLSGLDRGTYSSGGKVYIKSAAYTAAQGRVQEHRILDYKYTHTNDVQARVAVKIKDEWQEHELLLKRTEKEGLLNDAWKLDQPAQVEQYVNAPFPIDRIEINGYPLSLGQSQSIAENTDAGRWNLVLLPGDYTLSMPKDSYYSLKGMQKPIHVTLGAQRVRDVNLEVRPSERMWLETDEAVEKALKKCLESRSLSATGCPSSTKYSESGMSLTGRNAVPLPTETPTAASSPSDRASQSKDEQVKITDIAWELKDRPALVLESDGNDPTHWKARQYRPAIFELTYKANGDAQRETIPMNIEAHVKSTGKTATIDVALTSPGGDQ